MAARHATITLRKICTNGRSSLPIGRKSSVNLVDTLKLVRDLESRGMPTQKAEGISKAIVDAVSESLERVAGKYVDKDSFDHSLKLQETMQQNDTLKLGKQINEVKLKLDCENEAWKNQLEEVKRIVKAEVKHAKSEVLKYSTVTLISAATVGFGILHYVS